MLQKFKLLHSFYVFIKEVILGEATLKQAYKYDRRRVYVLAVILLSLIFNVISIPIAYKSLHKVIELKIVIVELKTNPSKVN